MPKGITTVAQGELVATSLKDYLQRHPEMDAKCTKGGNCTYYTTEAEEKFTESASTFLNEAGNCAANRVIIAKHLRIKQIFSPKYLLYL